MSDRPWEFQLPPVPMMSAEEAQTRSRTLQGIAAYLTDIGDRGLARAAERRALWYMTYANNLAQTKPEGGA